jgi:4-amino-4-deoxy-L-arabinose transferase-like glycosyltransferase
MGPSLRVPKRRLALTATGLVICLASCKLIIHLYAGRHYGYFTDELYYLACSRHLDWGYVDQPPLIALVTWMARSVLGESLPALRFLPAVAGAGEVALTALIARELGGKRFAQGLAALATLAAPGILGGDGFLSMNAFEPLFWMGCAWLLIRTVKTGDHRLWIWFGVLAGFGLENKYSMGIFGAGIVLGLLLTAQRRELKSKWLWIAGAIAFLLFLPNLLWNIQRHFPFLELQANIRRSGRDVPLTPLAFFGQEIQAMNPLSVTLWLAGLWFYFLTPSGKPFRALGWAWVFTALIIVTQSPRVYYLFPGFPILFAAGAVVWEAWLNRPRFSWLKVAWPISLAAVALVFAPFAIPLLPPATYIRYADAMHLKQPRIETHKLGPLPQLFADQFGWPEMAATVAGVYNSLPPAVRSKTAVFGQNYGQAGAIDLFGPQYGLPPAISGHQSYFLWGPRDYTGESMIVMDDTQQRLEELFATVKQAATVYHPYSMPYQQFDVFYCTGLKIPMAQLWPQVKRWD